MQFVMVIAIRNSRWHLQQLMAITTVDAISNSLAFTKVVPFYNSRSQLRQLMLIQTKVHCRFHKEHEVLIAEILVTNTNTNPNPNQLQTKRVNR